MDEILYEDDTFMLLPDTKWAHPRTSDTLYCLAICHDRSIRSVRDLRAHHRSLLENIRDAGLACLAQKFQVAASQLRIFVHYQPSYYHFHVHFVHTSQNSGTNAVGKAILLETILYNLNRDGDYYHHATLPYLIGQDHGLAKNIGAVSHRME